MSNEWMGGQFYRRGTSVNELRDRANSYMDPDPDRGFTTAVRNGQIRLALEYAVILLHQQSERIAKLEANQISAVTQEPEPKRRRRAHTDEGQETPNPHPVEPPPPDTPDTPVQEEKSTS